MNRLHASALMASLFLAPLPLLAQDTGSHPRLMRGDVSGTVGWVSTNKGDLAYDHYNDWRSQAGFSLGAGWYWTDHHQTRVEVAGTTETTVYSAVPSPFAGGQSIIPVRRSFESRRISVTQHYQFRRNEWVHPFVGAGVDFVRERVSGKDDPVFSYDPITRQSRLVRDAVEHAARDENTARGVLTAGVKAYLSRKVFAVTDLRVSIGGRRTEDVQWRFGLGADF
jgi:opacity protein-like surface antigen